jgi:hypothetical protein
VRVLKIIALAEELFLFVICPKAPSMTRSNLSQFKAIQSL